MVGRICFRCFATGFGGCFGAGDPATLALAGAQRAADGEGEADAGVRAGVEVRAVSAGPAAEALCGGVELGRADVGGREQLDLGARVVAEDVQAGQEP